MQEVQENVQTQNDALDFLFAQSRTPAEKVDPTLGYQEPVCRISSSEEGSYVQFNEVVLNHFGLEKDQKYTTVFAQNPATKEITFVIYSQEEFDSLQKNPVNAYKVQKGALTNGFIQISSKPAISLLLNVDMKAENPSWEENVLSVELHNSSVNYITVEPLFRQQEELPF